MREIAKEILRGISMPEFRDSAQRALLACDMEDVVFRTTPGTPATELHKIWKARRNGPFLPSTEYQRIDALLEHLAQMNEELVRILVIRTGLASGLVFYDEKEKGFSLFWSEL